MNWNFLYFTVFIALIQSNALAQEDTTSSETPVEETITEDELEPAFLSTRIINGHSVETLNKGVLEFRVEHHFGDLAGDEGGVQTFWGLDNSADIRLALEYGITDKFMVGAGRSKGTGEPYRSLIDGFAKYRILEQKKGGMPLSLSALGTMSYSYMKASEDTSLVSYFPKQSHRLAYCTQLNVAKNFGNIISIAIMPTLVHRNYVKSDDQNTLFALGGAFRWAISGKIGIMVEYYHCLHSDDVRQTKNSDGSNLYQNSLSFAFEWRTFGHNFTIYLTNARGFGETQFIADTYDQWSKGQFRLGFCISRKFEFE